MGRQHKCGTCGVNPVNGAGWICGECRRSGQSKVHGRYLQVQDNKQASGEVVSLAETATQNSREGRAAFKELEKRLGKKEATKRVRAIMDRGAGKSSRFWNKSKHDGGDAK